MGDEFEVVNDFVVLNKEGEPAKKSKRSIFGFPSIFDFVMATKSTGCLFHNSTYHRCPKCINGSIICFEDVRCCDCGINFILMKSLDV
jgi:hypothetical protein